VSAQRDELRRRAEEIARGKTAGSPDELTALSPEEVWRTVHELRVHRAELELQNEELRRAQVELDAARARYFELYDLAPVGYCTLGQRGLILEANLAAATLLDVARGGLVKQPITRFILPEDQDIYYRYRKHLLKPGVAQDCELRMIRKDGTTPWVRLRVAAAGDADGAGICRVVMSDITEHRRAELALRESAELTALGRLVAGMAHEVRNPLFAVTASLDVLEAQMGERLGAEPYFRRMREQLDRLSRLMSGLIEYGPSQALQLRPEPIETILRDAVRGLATLADRRHVELRVVLPEGPFSVQADAGQLRQALQNVIANALQHSPEGGAVSVEAGHRRSGAREEIEIVVRDAGPGFPAEDLERAFEPFFTRCPGSTGLGLSIARRIAQEHGGHAWIANHPDGGAVVTIALPADG
jgi:PAS domain S-box-containing protein